MNPEQKPPALEMQAVTISAMRDVTFEVVKNINWTVMPGEFWVVAGQQQSGKTDFLMMAAGLMPPMAGTYRLFGRDTHDFGEAELPERLRVGFIFAGGQLFNQLTIAENVALPLRYHRNLEAEAAGRETHALLELLELTPLADITPGNVSLDWRMRTALARALVLQPQVLLCDNPLNGLGVRHRQWWLKFLDQLAQGHERFGGQPMTQIVTTEELPPWKSGGRRFAVLRDKQFLPVGSWAELEKAGNVAVNELMVVPHETTI